MFLGQSAFALWQIDLGFESEQENNSSKQLPAQIQTFFLIKRGIVLRGNSILLWFH